MRGDIKRWCLLLLIFFPIWAKTGIAPNLQRELSRARGEDKVPIIVVMKERIAVAQYRGQPSALIATLRQTAQTTQQPLLHFLQTESAKGKVEKVRSFWIINGIACVATKDVIQEISQRDDVEEVYLDEVITLPPVREGIAQAPMQNVEWGVARIKAPEVWAKGYRGQGVLVGIIDSGVDVNHPDLRDKWRSQNGWHDSTDNPSATPTDPEGHGTHCMGTIVGGNASGRWIGVAPDAKFIASRALTTAGGQSSWILDSMQWMMDPDGDPATHDFPAVVNCSWGHSSDSPALNPVFSQAIQAWINLGIFPAFALGNDGPAPMTTNSPGDYPNAFAVGATDSNDQIADFSSRGPVVWDGVTYIKPDVCAPGVNIYSTAPNGGYATMSGTSQACPHVAGVVALIKSRYPTMSVEAIKSRLRRAVVDLGPAGPDNDYGWGRIDASKAVNLAPILSNGKVDPTWGKKDTVFTFTVTYSDPDGDPAQWVRVHITREGLDILGSPVTMTPAGGNDWKATFTLPSMEEGGNYTFYFEAYDGIDTSTTTPSTFFVQLSHQFPLIDMATIPLYLQGQTLEDIFGPAFDKTSIAWYNPSAGRYVFGNDPSFPSLNVGVGFWIKGSPVAIFNQGGEVAGDVEVPLKKGWNIVGFPYRSIKDIACIAIRTPEGGLVGLKEAEERKLVRGYLWGFAGKAYTLLHPDLPPESRTLYPWKAYWIKALTDGVSVVFSPLRGVSTRGSASPEGWMAQIRVFSKDSEDDSNYIGIGDSRFLSGVENPPSKGGVDLYFLRGEEKLAWDVREKAERCEWKVVVEGTGDITLSWPNLSSLPKGYVLYLVDGDKRVNMLTTSSYTFTSPAGRKEMSIVYERRGNALVVSGLTAKPVRGGVSIAFNLSMPAVVNLRVKAMDGRVLKEMRRDGAMGMNTLAWDGRDEKGNLLPAGIYMVEVVAKGDDATLARGITLFTLR